MEGGKLKDCPDTLFTGCLGTETDAEIRLNFAHRLGSCGERSKDRDILLGFPNWSMKLLALDVLWDKSKISVEGQQLTFCSDLCPLTLQKRREWKLLFSIPDKFRNSLQMGLSTQVIDRL